MFSQWIKDFRWAAVLIALLLAGLIGYGIYLAISRAGKEPVQVYLVPGDTTVTVNGERISAGTAYLKPGKYHIQAKRGGFADYSSNITVKSPNSAVIDIALEPVSDEAKKWQKDHNDLYLAYEGRAGERANVEGEAFSEQNPITSKLPFTNFLYTIGYRKDPGDPDGRSIIIEIDASPGYRQAALKKIRALGYDPTDFKINFRNYESPF